jgi:uncharacterized lipoprotein NlpE involved in copper resistance
MKKFFFIGCAIGLMILTNACKPKEQVNAADSNAVGSVSDNSKKLSNWEGVYSGTIPCADCPGISVSITLLSGNTYKMEYLYQEKEANKETFDGTFQWNEEGNVITLGNLDKNAFPVYYKVGENSITQLDMEGNEITGDLAENYVLAKAQ